MGMRRWLGVKGILGGGGGGGEMVVSDVITGFVRGWDGSAERRGSRVSSVVNTGTDPRCGVTVRETAAVKTRAAQGTPLCVVKSDVFFLFHSDASMHCTVHLGHARSAKGNPALPTLSVAVAASNMFYHHFVYMYFHRDLFIYM